MKKIILLKPYGWCIGVKLAIKKFNKIKQEHKNKKIYVMGDLVHNKFSLDLIKNKNIKFINTNNQILFLSELNKDSVIVFPAHGYDCSTFLYAQKKFKFVYELTCPYIKSNIKLIKNLLSEGKHVYFFGLKNHSESRAILSIDKSIKLITSLRQIKNISKNSFLLNQSTFPIRYLKNLSKNINYIPTTCPATNQRHENILNLCPNIKLLIVVGDKKSFNTINLYKLAKDKGLNTKLISSCDELQKINFENITNCAITSGTSTPKKVVDDVEKKLFVNSSS